MMFSMPPSTSLSTTPPISASVAPTQVRWAIAVSRASRSIHCTSSSVLARVDPPAP